MKTESGERTLVASVLLSSPGPIVLGIGLLLGYSSTQLADFVRRTAELAAIIISWIIFRVRKSGENNKTLKNSLERNASICAGCAMCLSGAAIIAVALLSSDAGKGNVIPGLTISVLGLTTNFWFWLRYRKLNHEKHDTIFAVQARLYGSKSLVDACVTAALAVVAAAPGSAGAFYMDFIGSVIVSVYMIINGIITISRYGRLA